MFKNIIYWMYGSTFIKYKFTITKDKINFIKICSRYESSKSKFKSENCPVNK